jgi:hypothetical protein
MKHTVDVEERLADLRRSHARLRTVTILAGAGLVVVVLLGAAKEPVFSGDVAVAGDLKCLRLQSENSGTFGGNVSVKGGLGVEGELTGPTIKALRDAFPLLEAKLALSRPYIAATVAGPQNLPVNSNPNPIDIQGLQASISSKSLPAVMIVSVLVSRARRRDSNGTMDLRVNGAVRSMVEPSDFGHRTDHTYVFTEILQPNGQAAVPISVTAVTYGASGPVLGGSVLVIPLGSPPRWVPIIHAGMFVASGWRDQDRQSFLEDTMTYECERHSKNVARRGGRWSVRKRSAPGLLPCIVDTMEWGFPFTGPCMEALGCSPIWRNGLRSAVAFWSTAKASDPSAASSTSTGIRYRKSLGTLSRPGTAAQTRGHDPSSIPSCP